MTNQTATNAGTHRLPPAPGQTIDRSRTLPFTFDRRPYTAHPGDTIASALAAHGVQVFSRSFKYHRPRGLLCCAGHCPNCLVQVDEEMNVRACTTPVQAGMAVRSQNAWPSLQADLLSLIRFIDRFLPVGFYYKTFIRPRFLWPLYEKTLRHAAGLGRVPPNPQPAHAAKQVLHTDVLVVGGGPAGIAAATAAASQGARVLLCDDQPASLPPSSLPGDRITTLPQAAVLSVYEDHWLSAAQGEQLLKIRARAVVFATGAYEQPLLFDQNDLPGIMLGSAVQRLLRLYGVAPGRQGVVVTANDDGWQVAADLLAAGISLAAVADERPAHASPLVEQVRAAGIPIFWQHTIQAARGRRAVSGALLVPLPPQNGTAQAIPGDLIALSTGWTPAAGLLYQAGVKMVYSEQRRTFLPPETLPPGIFLAGRVAGTFDASLATGEGRLAGSGAAAHAGFGQPPAPEELAALQEAKRAAQARNSAITQVPGGKKQFLCFCEDVTPADVETAIAEGYDSLELLKRYSTLSMGPCQGKMCSANAIALCARATGRSVAETGTTTARPPLAPVKLGLLAGQNFEPVKVSPAHAWHLEHGARMMVAGLWLRPEHYGDPQAEVAAVRQQVGLIDVSTLGKLRLTGPGVPALLERLYTNRWQGLATGRARYGLMTNDEGIILDDGVTARLAEEEWYTTTTSSGAGAIYEWLQWWAQSGWGEGVTITDVTENYAAFNLAGPRARQVLARLAAADISNQAFPYLGVRSLEVAGIPCRLLRLGFVGELSYEIHCPAGYGYALWQAIMAAGADLGIRPFGVEAQRVLRLEKGHIIIGQDSDALTDPFMAGMAWVVKLDKPDFLGRRSLLRLSQEGTAQRLVGFVMADPATVPEEGLQIVRPGPGPLGREIIGWVTSSRYSPTLKQAIGLCWLPAALAGQNGAAFTIWHEGALWPARVHHGPFYDAKGQRMRQ